MEPQSTAADRIAPQVGNQKEPAWLAEHCHVAGVAQAGVESVVEAGREFGEVRLETERCSRAGWVLALELDKTCSHQPPHGGHGVEELPGSLRIQ